jgi:hypothetical protein
MAFFCIHNTIMDDSAVSTLLCPKDPIDKASATNASRTRDHSTACRRQIP